jgi:hypothetical protein
MSRSPEERFEPVWYVRVQDRVWGPYPESRLEAFIAEGRVAAATWLSDAPDGPFRPAADHAALRPLFAASFEPVAEASPPSDRAPKADQTAENAGASRPLLVFVALATLDENAFQAVLAGHGPYERVGAGLWLVRARLGPAALRNALSRRLRGGDALLVVEATLDQAAWFNLDQTEERRLRALWAG